MDFKENAIKIAKILSESKAKNVIALDVSKLCAWTRFFVLATSTSSVHQRGLLGEVEKFAKNCSLTIFKTNRKTNDGDDWRLIDLGEIVVHLMSEEARTFYALEKLWREGEIIFSQNDE